MEIKKGHKISLFRYFFMSVVVLLVALLTVLISGGIALNDAYWHIKMGEYIVTLREIPETVIQSWSASDLQWKAHEWLFEALIYIVHSIGGLKLVSLIAIGLVVITVVITISNSEFVKQHKLPWVYIAFAIIPQITILSIGVQARPQRVSVILLALTIVILYKSFDKSKLLWVLPIITILWVNIHGGTSVLSWLITLIFAICNSINFNIGKIEFKRANSKWLKTIYVIVLAQIVGLCFNPYGTEMILYPFTNMSDSRMLENIVEWSAVDIKETSQLVLIMFPILAGIVSLIQTEKHVKSYDIALFFMFVILQLRSIRFMDYMFVAQTLTISGYAFRLKKEPEDNSIESYEPTMLDNVSILLIMCSSIFIFIYGCVTGISLKDYDLVTPELIQTIKDSNKERLLNNFNNNALLVYNGIETFVDGRYEPFNQNGILDDYYILTTTKSISDADKIDEVFNKWDFDSVLLDSTNVSLYVYIKNRDDFIEAYKDDNFIYYIQKE